MFFHNYIYFFHSFEKTGPRYTPRILCRRFALTPTAYKYLDIGINAGPASSVDFILGDNRGNQLVLPHATWTALIERRADIERLLQQATATSTLSIRDLTIQLVILRYAIIVKITLDDTCMYMKPSTILFLLELEQCVEHAYFRLCQMMQRVNDKFKYFATVLRQNCITDKCDARRILREVSDEKSLVDCELLAYALENIMYNAVNM